MSVSVQRLGAGATVAAVAGVVTAPLAFLASPAQAATACADATPAATLVGAHVCEVVMTADGTFTAPSGVSKIQALVVGGGGGSAVGSVSRFAYGGGGGEVVLVTSVASGNHVVTVGLGGAGAADSLAGDGGSTTLDSTTAVGGGGANFYGPSGSSPAGAGNGVNSYLNPPADCGGGDTSYQFGEGAGAGGAAVYGDFEGAPGLAASTLTGADSTLWPSLLGETEYAPGGAACVSSVTQDVAGAGGSADLVAYSDGHDGAVIFRWEANVLPDTGAPNLTWTALAAGALATSGALAIAWHRRRSVTQ